MTTPATTEAPVVPSPPTPAPELLVKVLERVDFFFGDANFRRDRFLRMQSDSNPGRFVPISILLSFNTLKALTTDVAVVAIAAKTSEIAELNPEGTALRRKVKACAPLNPRENKIRVFASSFPGDTKWTQVRDAFAACGKVQFVQLRRQHLSKTFLGSAFVDFATEAGAVKAVASPPTFNGAALEKVLPFAIWLDEHRKEREAQQPGRPGGNGFRTAMNPRPPSIMEMEQNKFILRVSNIGEHGSWQDVKRVFVDFCSEMKPKTMAPKFVDISEGVAFARFEQTPEEAVELLKELESAKLTLGELELKVEAASEADKAAYWERTFSSKKEKSVKRKIDKKRHEKKMFLRNKSRQGNRDQNGRKRRHSRTAQQTAPATKVEAKTETVTEPAAKKAKTETAAVPAPKKAEATTTTE